jgi:hypothetical protein
MSANTGIVTHGGASHEVGQYYDSVIVQLPNTGHTKTTKYCFIGRADPWTDDPNTVNIEGELSPPSPSLSQINLKKTYKNMFLIKRVYPQDMRPMIDRFDWTTGTVYDYYRDDIDIIAKNSNGRIISKHYVRNKFDQVFKCLWNNNGAVSTIEPVFEPGSMNSTGVIKTSDNYKWIYIYTIEAALKQKFLDDAWMPCNLPSTSGIGQFNVDSGNIPVAVVYDGGSNYYSSNTTVTIEGANTVQAIAIPVISNGVITDINITNKGRNYISANVIINSPTGTGANAAVFVSPVNGHGSDPFEEFGVSHVMVTNTFTKDESHKIPTNINFRQIGFIINPVAKSTYPNQCEETLYSCTTDLVVSNGFKSYEFDEIVYQGNSLETSTFSGTVLNFDETTNVLRLINIEGTPASATTLVGNNTKTLRTVLTITEPDFIPYSGYITYIENRTGTQRSVDGTEQVRLVVGFN